MGTSSRWMRVAILPSVLLIATATDCSDDTGPSGGPCEKMKPHAVVLATRQPASAVHNARCVDLIVRPPVRDMGLPNYPLTWES